MEDSSECKNLKTAALTRPSTLTLFIPCIVAISKEIVHMMLKIWKYHYKYTSTQRKKIEDAGGRYMILYLSRAYLTLAKGCLSL